MKKYLITGLIILLPAVLTLFIVKLLFDFFTTPFVPIISAILAEFSLSLPESVTIFLSRLIAFVLLLLLIFLLGLLAQRFFFKNIGQVFHRVLSRIPLVKTVYKLSRDMFSALFAPDGQHAFKETVMTPFPQYPHYAMGFTAGEVPEEVQQKIGAEPLASVFTPTAPHPISGFLFMIPKKDVRTLKMSKEDAVKYLVSCGVIHPEAEQTDDHL